MLARARSLVPLALSVAALAACGDDASSSPSSSSGSSGSSGGAEAGGARTLASCTTSIAEDAPSFFKTYFRCVTITTSADAITIQTEGLPPHLTSYYGTASANYAPFDTSRGAAYKANPNLLKATNAKFTIPRAPTARGVIVSAAIVDGVVGTAPQEYPMGPAGVAIDSVLLFNPLAAPGDDIEKEKFTFDDYDAHPAPGGEYHYHTASKGPLEVLTSLGVTGVELYGIMCDGTVVLGCTELDGTKPSLSALDAQGGHVGDVKDQSTTHFDARYHVHVCPSDAAGRRFTPEIQYYSACTR